MSKHACSMLSVFICVTDVQAENLGIASPLDCKCLSFPPNSILVYCSNCIIASLIAVNKFPSSPIITAALLCPRRRHPWQRSDRVNEWPEAEKSKWSERLTSFTNKPLTCHLMALALLCPFEAQVSLWAILIDGWWHDGESGDTGGKGFQSCWPS